MTRSISSEFQSQHFVSSLPVRYGSRGGILTVDIRAKVTLEARLIDTRHFSGEGGGSREADVKVVEMGAVPSTVLPVVLLGRGLQPLGGHRGGRGEGEGGGEQDGLELHGGNCCCSRSEWSVSKVWRNR